MKRHPKSATGIRFTISIRFQQARSINNENKTTTLSTMLSHNTMCRNYY